LYVNALKEIISFIVMANLNNYRFEKLQSKNPLILYHFDLMDESNKVRIAFIEVSDMRGVVTIKGALRKKIGLEVITEDLSLISLYSIGDVIVNKVRVNTLSYEKEVILKDVNLFNLPAISLSNIYEEYFEERNLVYLTQIFSDIELIKIQRRIGDKDIIFLIPCAIILKRFCGIDKTAMDSILEIGFDNPEKKEIIFKDYSKIDEIKTRRLSLAVGVDINSALFWGQYLIYPEMKQIVTQFLLDLELPLMKDRSAKVPLRFTWPINDQLSEVKFLGRMMSFRGVHFMLVSDIGRVVGKNVDFQIVQEITLKEQNEMDLKKKQKRTILNPVLPNDGKPSQPVKIGKTSEKGLYSILDTTIDSELFYGLPNLITKINKKLKRPGSTNILNVEVDGVGTNSTEEDGQKNSGVNTQSKEKNDDNEIEDDFSYYSLTPKLAKKINTQGRCFLTEYKLILESMNSTDNFTKSQRVMFYNYSHSGITVEAVEFCFLHRTKSARNDMDKRKRKVAILKIYHNSNEHYFVDFEPTRGSSTYAYLLVNSTFEQVKKFITHYVIKLGKSAAIEKYKKENGTIHRIIHQCEGTLKDKGVRRYRVKALRDEEGYIEIIMKSIISKILK
jgi:hypothetical protein